MASSKKAFFDFDGTLVDFDTVNPFIRYVLKSHPELDVEPDRTLPHKQYRLKLLAGLSAFELRELAKRFYYDEVRPFLVKETIAQLSSLRNNGYEIIIVSGSYDLYLQFFCEEFDINCLICTEIAFFGEGGAIASVQELTEARVSLDGFVCAGEFRSLDCLGENKLHLMDEKLGKSNYRSSESVAFSDSVTDLPLLLSCQKAVVVVPRHMHEGGWVDEQGFDILRYRYPLRRRLFRKLCYYARKIVGMSS